MSRTTLATTYLQIVKNPNIAIRGKVIRSTQRYPTVVEPGAVVVKIQLRIPEAAFLPLTPEAVIEIPESLTQHPVEVEAMDPS